MKKLSHILVFAVATLLFVGSAHAQFLRDLQNFRTPGQAGINVFEPPMQAAQNIEGPYLRVGGDFAIQFQGLDHSNDLGNLVELAPNLTLPTANLNLDVQFTDGVRMHLRTYLSSRHHNEAWVKGGYFQIDDLDFISEGFLAGLMEVTRFRVGMDEINYGDAHFRRSDNAAAIYNPFVGNFIMDSFTTEPFIEVTVMSDGFLGVAGITNGRLNQSPKPGDNGIALFGKLGYDSQINPDLRFRLTGSVYHSTKEGTRDYLYGGDRAGARYYGILEAVDDARVSDFLPRFNPGFPYLTSFQINPFLRFQGLEFFGIIERTTSGATDGNYTQLGGELLYRFGTREQFYLGGRYNTVNGDAGDGLSQTINRVNVGGGWFLTENVLTKVEYVTSTYDGEGFDNTKFAGAQFDGVMFEAVISF